MGSIEKPLPVTSGLEYLSNDKPIQSRHYSVLLPMTEASLGKDEPVCVGGGHCKKNKQRICRFLMMIFIGFGKCVCEVEAVFVKPCA